MDLTTFLTERRTPNCNLEGEFVSREAWTRLSSMPYLSPLTMSLYHDTVDPHEQTLAIFQMKCVCWQDDDIDAFLTGCPCTEACRSLKICNEK